MLSNKLVIFLMGPTASGKTNFAIEIAKKYSVRIISVDSAMIYKGMDIGTAKPDKKTLIKFPHYLVDIVPLMKFILQVVLSVMRPSKST
jgi:tRNA dimethylallyltransferase